MTFKRFEELLHSKYPAAHTCAHGQFAGTERNGKVEINFYPNGKCYEYYGSYQDILKKVGIVAIHKSDVEYARKQMARYEDMNGKPNPFSLFENAVCDYTKEIEHLKRFIGNAEKGLYIYID